MFPRIGIHTKKGVLLRISLLDAFIFYEMNYGVNQDSKHYLLSLECQSEFLKGTTMRPYGRESLSEIAHDLGF